MRKKMRMRIRSLLFPISLAFSCVLHAAVMCGSLMLHNTSSRVGNGGDEALIIVSLSEMHEVRALPQPDIPDHDETDSRLPAGQAADSFPQALTRRDSDGGSAADPYFTLLRERIIREKRYPVRARWLNISGATTVSFTVRPDGGVDDIHVLSGSGHPLLDRESCKAIRRATPFPPPPIDISSDLLNIMLTLKYEL